MINGLEESFLFLSQKLPSVIENVAFEKSWNKNLWKLTSYGSLLNSMLHSPLYFNSLLTISKWKFQKWSILHFFTKKKYKQFLQNELFIIPIVSNVFIGQSCDVIFNMWMSQVIKKGVMENIYIVSYLRMR